MTAESAAIIVAGGRASRLGGADKASIPIEGRMLLDHVLAAVDACSPIIVVGPPHLAQAPGRTPITLVREDPPFTGPVAALEAALTAVSDDTEETWLLACDLPRASDVVAQLAAPIPPGYDAVVLVDAQGHPQWLAGRYRTKALRAALATLPRTAGASMRQLLASIRVFEVPDPTGASDDIDTWAQIDDYRSSKEEQLADTPEDLDAWVTELATALDIDATTVPTGALLDLTRDVAHGITRPAGPLTTYLVGLAAARGTDVDAAMETVTELLERRTS